MTWSNSVFQDSLLWRNLLLPQSVYMGGYTSEQASSFFEQQLSPCRWQVKENTWNSTLFKGRFTKFMNPQSGSTPNPRSCPGQGSEGVREQQRCSRWGVSPEQDRAGPGCAAQTAQLIHPLVLLGLFLTPRHWARAVAPYPEQRLPLSPSPLLQFLCTTEGKIQERKHWSKINYH